MICNPWKCKEIIFRTKGFIQDIAQVNDIPPYTKLPILGVTFQENCKYSEHVRAKLIKANKCLLVLRSLRKGGFSQGKVDHLFSAYISFTEFRLWSACLWCGRLRSHGHTKVSG